MAESNQQAGHSPSQIAANARSGGHGDGQQLGGRSPSAIAAAARGGVHGPEAGQDRGVQGHSVQPDRSPSQIAAAARGGVHGPEAGQDRGVQGGLLGISPSQIADNALRGVVNTIIGGHTLFNDPKEPGLKEVEWGERRDGKGWAEVIKDGRQENNPEGDGGGPPPERGRTLPEEQKQKEKEQERDKGRSLSEQAREWVHEHEMGCGY